MNNSALLAGGAEYIGGRVVQSLIVRGDGAVVIDNPNAGFHDTDVINEDHARAGKLSGI